MVPRPRLPEVGPKQKAPPRDRRPRERFGKVDAGKLDAPENATEARQPQGAWSRRSFGLGPGGAA
jgi:hypothetical protein